MLKSKTKSETVKSTGRELPAGGGLAKDAATVTAGATEAAGREAKPLPAKKQKAASAQPVPDPKAAMAKAATPTAPGAKSAFPERADDAAAAKPKATKQEQVLTMLAQVGGVTIDEVMKTTGWQQHSVRGFFAGTVRKKLGFDLVSETGEGGERRYAIKIKT